MSIPTNKMLYERTISEKVTEISKALSIYNCADVSSKLDIVSGNTYQETRSGKNLYNIFDINAMATSGVTIDKDGWITITCDNSSGTTTKIFDCMVNTNSKLSTSTSYNIITEVKSKSGTGYLTINEGGRKDTQIATDLIYNIGTLENNTIYNKLVTSNSSFDSSVNIVRQYAYFNAGQSGSITYRISLLADTSITPETFTYEAYGIMPSPDYPSIIRNVGSNINIFSTNNDNITYLSRTGTTETYTINDTNSLTVKGIDCTWTRVSITINNLKPNTKYRMSAKVVNASNHNAGLLVEDDINNVNHISANTNFTAKIQFTTDKNGSITIQAFSNWSGTSLSESVTFNDIEVKECLVKTMYTPYNCGSMDFKIHNKNLCYNAIVYSTTNLYLYVYSKSIKQKELFLSFITNSNLKNNSLYLRIDGVDAPDVLIGKVSGTSGNTVSISFTLTDANYNAIKKSKEICFIVYKNGAGFTKIENAMIIEGLNTIDYIPHKEQIKSFPFTEGQVLHKGDYLASDGIHQKRNIYEITGNEDFIFSVDKNRIYMEVSKLLDNIKIDFSDETKKPNLICSHFTIYPFHIIYNATNLDGIGVSGGNNLSIFIKGFTSLDDYKAYLTEQYANGTPVTIEYDLAEEIVIPYTKTQEEYYYQLQHTLLYEDVTHISCIDEIEPDIQCTYWYNNELNKSYGKRLDKVEDSINELEKETLLWSGNKMSGTFTLTESPYKFRYLLFTLKCREQGISILVPCVSSGSGSYIYSIVENSLYTWHIGGIWITNMTDNSITVYGGNYDGKLSGGSGITFSGDVYIQEIKGYK